MIKEVFLLRTIACLAIVLGHCINSSLNLYPHITTGVTTDLWKLTRELLLFGTPVFIFISALVLSYSYPNGTPKGFLVKRLKFILVPYAIMGVFYAILTSLIEGSFNNLPLTIASNLFLGQFHGYFIIIIFQFYLLHTVFHKIISLIKIEKIVLCSLIINVIYLQISKVYFYDAKWGVQLWWFPLFAWIFYYSLAYYLGQNINKFRMKLDQYKWILLFVSIITSALVIILYRSNIIPPLGSKRIDILLFTTCICFLLFYIGTKMRQIPFLISIISAYSFGIYWLHVFYIQVLHKLYKLLSIGHQSFINLTGYIFVLFIGSTLLSIVTVYLLNRFRFGAYVTGKIGVLYRNNQEYKKNVPYDNQLTR